MGRSASSAALLLALIAGVLFAAAPSADASISSARTLPDGTQQTTYRIGPLNVTSGQNRIAYKPITGAERPAVNGWITRI